MCGRARSRIRGRVGRICRSVFVFVVGTGRCGTTLLHELLCRHRGTGFISNVDDKLDVLNLSGRWNPALFRMTAQRPASLRPLKDARWLFERGRLRVAPSEGWRILDRQVVSGFSRPCRDLLASDATPWLRGRIRDFFERRRDAQQAEVFVHRLTGWPRVGLLHAALPEARFIHVARDGRAVANSWLQMGWWDGYRGPGSWYLGPLAPADEQTWVGSGRSFPVLAALGWQMLIEAHEEARAQLPANLWHDVRYEDLLSDPERHVPAIAGAAGLTWDGEFASRTR